MLNNLSSESLEITLRQFELTLLEHMGQPYEWSLDFRSGLVVDEKAYYGFYVEQGMARVSESYAIKSPSSCFYGADLLQLANGNIENVSTLKMAKRLLRLALRPIIGYKPLQARELLMQFRQISQ